MVLSNERLVSDDIDRSIIAAWGVVDDNQDAKLTGLQSEPSIKASCGRDEARRRVRKTGALKSKCHQDTGGRVHTLTLWSVSVDQPGTNIARQFQDI